MITDHADDNIPFAVSEIIRQISESLRRGLHAAQILVHIVGKTSEIRFNVDSITGRIILLISTMILESSFL
jgi:hypothetical protein